tara:strand:- start:479 stop:901 length:423 start_codon:yes stop_codon:yes gene_type:complete
MNEETKVPKITADQTKLNNIQEKISIINSYAYLDNAAIVKSHKESGIVEIKKAIDGVPTDKEIKSCTDSICKSLQSLSKKHRNNLTKVAKKNAGIEETAKERKQRIMNNTILSMLSTKEKENLLAQAQEKKDKAKEKANE